MNGTSKAAGALVGEGSCKDFKEAIEYVKHLEDHAGRIPFAADLAASTE